MKNKLISSFFLILLTLNNFQLVFAEEFVFEVTDLVILENGNIYKGNNRGKITTDSKLELISDNFEYLKKINRLEANGNVVLIDYLNDVTIKAEKIFYLKDDEIIYTIGATFINVSDKYDIFGNDLTLFKNKQILSSNKKATITDKASNIYKLDQFKYSIIEEILKGDKIEIVKNNQKKSDQFFFENAFFDLKQKNFIAKDANIKLHKTLFDNSNNDPRIKSVTAYGDEFNTYFDKGIFTSCKKTDKCPPWKITSNKIHHDKLKKKVIYKNAWLNLYDIPVVYFPKFFHPDPTVERQSGLLKPQLGSHNTLGNSIYIPWFQIISDSKDVTIKPRLYNDNKFVLQNEYRQITDNSLTIIDMSIAKGHDSSSSDKNNTRSHFYSNTKVNLDFEKFINSTLEINYEHTNNDNYLTLFNLEGPLLKGGNVLESSVQLKLDHEDYNFSTSIEAFETLSGSNSDRYQYVLPSFNFGTNFDINQLPGSFNFSSGGSNTLADTNVLTSSLSNDLNFTSNYFFSEKGIKNNFEILFKNINTVGKNSAQYESSPQSELISSYIYNASFPLVKSTLDTFNKIEPKFSLRLTPHDMKDNKDKNRRLDANNIFNNNRLALSDTYEGGESATFGLNFTKDKNNTKDKIDEFDSYLDLKLATVFRFNEEKNIPTTSTLNKKRSNVFGQFGFTPSKNFSLDYNFSLTNDLNELEYNSIVTSGSYKNFNTQFEYVEERGTIGDLNTIENISSYNFNPYNSLSFKTRKDLKQNLTEYYDLLYEYKNDCLVASLRYKKNYYSDADIKPLEELFFSITIIPLTTFSPDKLILSNYR